MRSMETQATVLRAAVLNFDFETCESIRRQNYDSYMNRIVCASLVFSSSSLKQHSMASPPLLRVPEGGVYLGS